MDLSDIKGIEDVKILIADSDNALSGRMSRYLAESGFQVKVISNSYHLQKNILEWEPHFLFIDLLFPGYYAQKALRFLNERQLLGEDGVHVIVISKHNSVENVRNCLEAGAEDFIVKPPKMIDVLQRLTLLSQKKRPGSTHNLLQNEQQTKNYFQMVNLLVGAANQDKSIGQLRFEMTKMISMALKAVRVSLIGTNADQSLVQVLRSSDDPNLAGFKLDISKYPEIQYVLRTEKTLFIESLENDQHLSFVKDEVKTIQFDSMMVLPLKQGPEVIGCLSIRMPKDCKTLTYYDVKIAEIASQLIAMTWKFPNSAPAQEEAA